MIIAKFGKPDESRKIDDFLKYIEMNYEEEPIPPTLTKDFKTQLKTGAKAKRFLRKITKLEEGRKIDDFMKYIEMYLIIKNYRHYIRLISEEYDLDEERIQLLIKNIENGLFNPDSL